jgi:proline iminopeptidase
MIILLFFMSLTTACNSNKRESVLDRVEHIETELKTEIPNLPRLCDQLDLKIQRINVGDAELYVEEEGKGIPLVLINGGPGGTHHGFHPWFSRLKKHARIIYYDQRGCGLSDFKPGKDGYSVQQAVADLDAVRKAKNIDKWIVLGYSYGGFLAQYYTINYPQHVAGLVLMGASPGLWTDTGSSRQYQFITEKERARMKVVRKQLGELYKQKKIDRKRYIQLLIVNNNLNGDWKRQNFYKPSLESIIRVALYEWVNDKGFNSILNQSADKVNLAGAFQSNPIPTMILEGKWDLTWGKEKVDLLKNNHPNASFVLFENAGHEIFNEEPEKFFTVMEDFINTLPEVPGSKITAYLSFLDNWKKQLAKRIKEKPGFYLNSVGWGLNSSLEIAKNYSRTWLQKFEADRDYLRTGFALYDSKNYTEALYVFEQMQAFIATQEDSYYKGVALIWQGHMLDLLDRREDAVSRYRRASELNIGNQIMHGQYGMNFNVSPYAAQRIETPFQRVENNSFD